ncbi:MAG: hypothetical protein AAFY99_11925 [Pseudomonadota bacterium]
MSLFKSTAFFVSLAFVSFTFAQTANADEQAAGKENYMQADANNDGLLTYDEFVTFIDLNAADGLGNASMVASRNMYSRGFNRVDANKDGVVSPDELQTIQ